MTQQLDPVSVSVAIAGVLVGPGLADLVGPYAVIILAATTGAGWSLSKRESVPRWTAVLFFLRLNALAVLITVGLATLATKVWPTMGDVNWMLAPISLLVGGIGDDWPQVGRWIVERIGRRVDGPTGGGQ